MYLACAVCAGAPGGYGGISVQHQAPVKHAGIQLADRAAGPWLSDLPDLWAARVWAFLGSAQQLSCLQIGNWKLKFWKVELEIGILELGILNWKMKFGIGKLIWNWKMQFAIGELYLKF